MHFSRIETALGDEATAPPHLLLRRRGGASSCYESYGSDLTTTARSIFRTACLLFHVYFAELSRNFHAVVETWIGGQCVLFDPPRVAPVDR